MNGMYIACEVFAHSLYEGIATEKLTRNSRSIRPITKLCLKFFLNASQ